MGGEGECVVNDLMSTIRVEGMMRTGYRCEQPDAYLGARLHGVGLQKDLDFGRQGTAGAVFPLLCRSKLGPGT